MKPYQDIIQIVNNFHELGETIQAAQFLLNEYDLNHDNFSGFELREIAKADFILMTTEGIFGEKQIIRIPENTFEFPLDLMLTLLAHEMVHVGQKQTGFLVKDKNEREWQAYYEMIFHNIYTNIPKLSNFYVQSFAKKALEYYNLMGENSELQYVYQKQKIEVEKLLLLS
jgi:predicted metal-dependent peptidase